MSGENMYILQNRVQLPKPPGIAVVALYVKERVTIYHPLEKGKSKEVLVKQFECIFKKFVKLSSNRLLFIQYMWIQLCVHQYEDWFQM